jgi:hypothetical protein
VPSADGPFAGVADVRFVQCASDAKVTPTPSSGFTYPYKVRIKYKHKVATFYEFLSACTESQAMKGGARTIVIEAPKSKGTSKAAKLLGGILEKQPQAEQGDPILIIITTAAGAGHGSGSKKKKKIAAPTD